MPPFSIQRIPQWLPTAMLVTASVLATQLMKEVVSEDDFQCMIGL